MTIPAISPLPPAPSRASDAPRIFAAKADAHVASLSTLVTQINAASVAIDAAGVGVGIALTDAQTAHNDAENASYSAFLAAGDAEQHRDAAQAARDAAITAKNQAQAAANPPVQALGTVGASAAINVSGHRTVSLTLAEAVTTISFTGAPALDSLEVTLILKQGSGGHAVTWPGVKWTFGTPPNLAYAAGAEDIVTLLFVAGAVYGLHNGAFYA